MQLPYSANAILANLDVTAGVVQIVSNSTIPYVKAVLDPISGLSAYQLTQANQPSFARLGNNGYPDISFDGVSDHLIFDSMASKLATLASFTVFVVASTSTPAGTNMDLFTLGKDAADGYTRLFISGSKAGFADKNDAATVVAPATAGTVDTKTHLYTLIKDTSTGTIKVRLDGTQIISASVSGAHSYNTCTLAALRNNNTTSNYAKIQISEVAVYNKVADLTSVENYFVNKYLKTTRNV